MSSSNFRSSTTSSFSIRSCGRKKCTRSKGVLPCQAMPHTSSGSVKVEQKWKQPQYLPLNHVLSPFHTQGDSQHRNIVDLHMGDVTGREWDVNKPMLFLQQRKLIGCSFQPYYGEFCNKCVFSSPHVWAFWPRPCGCRAACGAPSERTPAPSWSCHWTRWSSRPTCSRRTREPRHGDQGAPSQPRVFTFLLDLPPAFLLQLPTSVTLGGVHCTATTTKTLCQLSPSLPSCTHSTLIGQSLHKFGFLKICLLSFCCFCEPGWILPALYLSSTIWKHQCHLYLS